jgi:ribose transport system permease protein
MATLPVRSSSAAASTYLLVPMVLFFALLIVAVLRSESLVTGAGLGSAVIVATPLILATYALMATVIAGRGTVDLSIGPLIGFINVTLVQLFGQDIISSPIAFFLYALGVGVLYQLLMGLIIVFVRVQPIIVSLSGYLALSGINLVILVRPGGTTPEWMGDWGLGISIFSPVTAILIIATVAWLLFTRTAFYGHLRLMGSDERAAFTSGVRINLVRLGAHAISGLFAGLAALTYTSLISSGDPTQGTTYTLIAVTALVLGGASLAGGRGGAIGSLLGAVNIYLITYVLATFNFGAVQSFVTDLAYGTILVLSLLLTVVLPHIRGVVQSISPLLFFVILSIIGLGVIIHATYDYSAPAAAAATAAATPTAGSSFIFEQTGAAATLAGGSSLAGPLAVAGLLILSVLIILRSMVAQAGKTRSLSPLVYIVVAAFILFGVYVVANPESVTGLGATTTQSAP